ncbi:MAG: FAD-binding protein [Kiloniellales bacterium]
MSLTRRRLLEAVGIIAGSALTLPGSFAPTVMAAGNWAHGPAFEALKDRLGERLLAVTSPLQPCLASAGSAACTERLEALQNPFFIQDQPGGFQTNGWLKAWTAEVSPFAVAAESAEDVAAGVTFARDQGVKLVVKGAAHDYLGRNSAPDSLLVWTHRMREVSFDPDFRIAGGDSASPGLPALSAGAGTRWIEAYQAASAADRYVQGGGCTSVGVAGGFIQGGGFGSFSKRYGTGAGSVLEFEVVTADGKIRIANAVQNSDLFWALRGGGGSTFGIVTRVTLLTHPRPKTVGLFSGRIVAGSDEKLRTALQQLVAWYPQALNNPDWGEQIAIKPDNDIDIFMTFLDVSAEAALALWQPLKSALEGEGITVELQAKTLPFAALWDQGAWEKGDPAFIRRDSRADAEPDHYWWAPNQGEVGQFIDSYTSRWLPRSLFEQETAPALAEALFDASRHARIVLHINKGLSGASEEVLAREGTTSVNPLAQEAAALVISTATQQRRYPGLAGHEPDLESGRIAAEKVTAAIAVLRAATPGGGAYVNEADYFEPDWQQSFYGPHYERLLAIKRKYDPGNLFRVHHGVGSG